MTQPDPQVTTPEDPTPITKPLSLGLMLFLGFSVGIIGGFGAILFRQLISFFHNLLFYGQLSVTHDANLHAAPSAWGMGVIFVPVVGVILVTWIVRRFAPEAKGHGVPEVIEAIYYKEGKIRPIVAMMKAVASAICIGSGGSVGREGPIIQIGSAFGSTVGQVIKMPSRQRITLIAAGAGAGIAATFNAPIGGVVFATELLLVSINAYTLSVVAIATVTAAYIGRMHLGMFPAFDIPELAELSASTTSLFELTLFLPFGILVGLASTLFIKMIYWFEDLFEAIPINPYVRNMMGMTIFGSVMYALFVSTGHYYVEGIGYATIVDVLASLISHPGFLLLLFFAKLFSTSLTLGSGGSGGVFSPSLFLGATLGSAFGKLMTLLFPFATLNPVMFAVAGMAGMVSGSTGAVVTAIVMLFEMTRDYNAILPIMLTVSLAYVIRIMVGCESIYTLKLLRRGREVHEGLQAATKTAQRAISVMNRHFTVLTHKQIKSQPGRLTNAKQQGKIIVLKEAGNIIGLLHGNLEDAEVQEISRENCLFVTPEVTLVTILRSMREEAKELVFVVKHAHSKRGKDLLGIITPREVTSMIGRTAELMNDAV